MHDYLGLFMHDYTQFTCNIPLPSAFPFQVGARKKAFGAIIGLVEQGNKKKLQVMFLILVHGFHRFKF
jgi:hypothetical protein